MFGFLLRISAECNSHFNFFRFMNLIGFGDNTQYKLGLIDHDADVIIMHAGTNNPKHSDSCKKPLQTERVSPFFRKKASVARSSMNVEIC